MEETGKMPVPRGEEMEKRQAGRLSHREGRREGSDGLEARPTKD